MDVPVSRGEAWREWRALDQWRSWDWVADPKRGERGFHAHMVHHHKSAEGLKGALRVADAFVRFCCENTAPEGSWWLLVSSPGAPRLLQGWMDTQRTRVSAKTLATYLASVRVLLEWCEYAFAAHQAWDYRSEVVAGLKSMIANVRRGLRHQTRRDRAIEDARRAQEDAMRGRSAFPTVEELREGTESALRRFLDLVPRCQNADPRSADLWEASALAMWVVHFGCALGLRAENLEKLTVAQASAMARGETALQGDFKTAQTYGLAGISVDSSPAAQAVLRLMLTVVRPQIAHAPQTDLAFLTPYGSSALSMRAVCKLVSDAHMPASLPRPVRPGDLRHVLAARTEDAADAGALSRAAADVAAFARLHSPAVARADYASRVNTARRRSQLGRQITADAVGPALAAPLAGTAAAVECFCAIDEAAELPDLPPKPERGAPWHPAEVLACHVARLFQTGKCIHRREFDDVARRFSLTGRLLQRRGLRAVVKRMSKSGFATAACNLAFVAAAERIVGGQTSEADAYASLRASE